MAISALARTTEDEEMITPSGKYTTTASISAKTFDLAVY